MEFRQKSLMNLSLGFFFPLERVKAPNSEYHRWVHRTYPTKIFRRFLGLFWPLFD